MANYNAQVQALLLKARNLGPGSEADALVAEARRLEALPQDGPPAPPTEPPHSDPDPTPPDPSATPETG